MRYQWLWVILVLGLFVGCGKAAVIQGDDADDVALTGAKEDGGYSECELREMLAFVNADGVTEASLKAAGLHTMAARYIAQFRESGTYATIKQLDDTKYVGKSAFKQLAAVVKDKCSGNTDPVTSNGSVEVIQSPQPYEKSHLAKTAQLLSEAKRTIDVAMYSISDSGMKSALIDAAKRGVSVRLIFEGAKDEKGAPAGTTSGKFEEAGIDVRYVNKIMHNKFVIVDGPRNAQDGWQNGIVVSGSGNWSSSAGTRFDENTVFMRGNTEMLVRFQQQFELMWTNSRDLVFKEFEFLSATSPSDSLFEDDPNLEVLFTSGNMKITQSSTYGATFSTIAGRNVVSDRISELIRGARHSIRIASGHMRSRPIAEALMQAKKDNPALEIQVYLDGQEYISSWYDSEQRGKLDDCLVKAGDSVSKQQSCTDSGFYYSYALEKAGIDLRFKYFAYRWHYSYAPQMHHKYLIIDDETVISGSYNLSDNAEHETLDNTVIYRKAGFPGVVASFVANFKSIYETGRAAGLFDKLKSQIKSATDEIPIVFDSMSLTWSEVTELKGLIQSTCPAINEADYREKPERHLVCKL